MNRLLCAVAALAASAACQATPATAGWSPDGATILSTSQHLQPVASCPDGAHGTFVVWQQSPSYGAAGVLRAQHVTPTGDVDGSWPAGGAVVCDEEIERVMLGALPDRQGGVYVWWKEEDALFLTRVQSGAVAAGWPARGRLLGTTSEAPSLPSIIEDGAHGIFAAWPSARVLGVHLGPDNTPAGGWAGGVRALLPAPPVQASELWPQLALAPEGGAYLGWRSASSDTSVLPSGYRLQRLTSAGQVFAGWPDEGLVVDPNISPFTASPMLAIAADGRGGAFAFTAGAIWNHARMYRVQGDGLNAPDWPAAGCDVLMGGGSQSTGPAGALRVVADRQDGVMFGAPAILTDSPLLMSFGFISSAGASTSVNGLWVANGLELVLSGPGQAYVATYDPDGPYHFWDTQAFIKFDGVPAGAELWESHEEPVLRWYGDVSIASTEDGGAVFFWSQERERFGLFARRATPGGELADVVPGIARTNALRGARYAAGRGVVVRLDASAGARLDLFDVAGRRVAATRLDQAASGEFTFAGTMSLSSGLYLARLSGAPQAARVVIVR